MTRRPTATTTFADEQSAILERVGLDETFCVESERIANDNAAIKQAAIELCGREPAGRAMAGTWPGKLSKAELRARAEVDAYFDRCLGRPMSIALRFTEQSLHYENFDQFSVYSEQFQTTYKAGAQ